MLKKRINRIYVLLSCSLCLGGLNAQKLNQAYLDYIDKYADIAVTEQKKYGIPASITLAQGLLESGAGQSELAVESNNHFGIKCHDTWTGQKYYYDDDRKNECFRKYRKVEDSYEDHSQFLLRPRYESLFKLKPTDYRAWAHGLKKAGYATDPKYAEKLISLIEDYDLHRFDTGKGKTKQEKQAAQENTLADETYTKKTSGKPASNASSIGTIASSLQHEVKKRNGVKYVIVSAGETFADLSVEFGIPENRLMRYNDVSQDRHFKGGERVYLQMKKNKAGKANTTHKVRADETMYDVAQLYGIKLKKLCALNGMPQNIPPFEGQVLRLR